MYSSEQQINNQLRQAGEQEELNHIRWQLRNSTKKSFYVGKPKDEGISEWVNHGIDMQIRQKNHMLSYLKRKQQEKSSRYAQMLEALSEQEHQSFLRYGKIVEAGSPKRQDSWKICSPKKLDLKLPIPDYLQRSNSHSEALERESHSLPMIKKVAIPISFLRNSEKRREKNTEDSLLYPLVIRENSEVSWNGPQKQEAEVYRKGRMMGMTRRQMKNVSFWGVKQQRRFSVNNSHLQECITFIK